MKTERKPLILRLAMIIFTVTVVLWDTASAQHNVVQHKEFDFKLKKTAIIESVCKNVVDKRTYESVDGHIIEFEAEMFRIDPNTIRSAFNHIRSKWSSCSDSEDVVSAKDQVVGSRMICTDVKEKIIAIIFTYDSILTAIVGNSRELVADFESKSCVRSKLVDGVPCKF